MPPTKEELHQQVDEAHSYHRPEFQDTMDDMGQIREMYRHLGHRLVNLLPISRELSIALHHNDDACMYSIAALARHEPDVGSTPNMTSHPLPESQSGIGTAAPGETPHDYPSAGGLASNPDKYRIPPDKEGESSPDKPFPSY